MNDNESTISSPDIHTQRVCDAAGAGGPFEYVWTVTRNGAFSRNVAM
jgi:hypothetical protein